MSSYLKNAWYTAAWSSEVGRHLFRRVIMDQPILLFRKEDGTAVALSNRCAHRFGPMHLGKLEGDTVSCPYHGLRYNSSGKCVFNPNGNRVTPAGARLGTYPLVERYGVLWIWPGDPVQADPTRIPDLGYLEDSEHYTRVHGLIEVRANYRYIIDNLLDGAHVATVHHDSLASESITRARPEVTVDGDTIWSNLICPPGTPAPIWDMLWKATRGEVPGPMDHWANSGWSPGAVVRQVTGITPVGQARDQGISTLNCHLLTPESEHTTHYFWAICRDFLLDNAELDKNMKIGAEYAFVEQDSRMLSAIQDTIGNQDFWGLKPCLLPDDVGAVKVRRRMDDLLKAESVATPA
jgi:phenylpropionate dioxygenase-like ring-hydroxylating dioxygenase large terminal subunit